MVSPKFKTSEYLIPLFMIIMYKLFYKLSSNKQNIYNLCKCQHIRIKTEHSIISPLEGTTICSHTNNQRYRNRMVIVIIQIICKNHSRIILQSELGTTTFKSTNSLSSPNQNKVLLTYNLNTYSSAYSNSTLQSSSVSPLSTQFTSPPSTNVEFLQIATQNHPPFLPVFLNLQFILVWLYEERKKEYYPEASTNFPSYSRRVSVAAFVIPTTTGITITHTTTRAIAVDIKIMFLRLRLLLEDSSTSNAGWTQKVSRSTVTYAYGQGAFGKAWYQDYCVLVLGLYGTEGTCVLSCQRSNRSTEDFVVKFLPQF
eukprot:TRINITY_DN2735_c0_g1_i7.p1 TRINITY_DN2735_c0_g1~~TRINITY_DN2735_c0_g1_i7.p1  ORF type:complete len:360 (+),score=-13.95 TRINITY_DN2735_c0_g1_i7:146-1081(+)